MTCWNYQWMGLSHRLGGIATPVAPGLLRGSAMGLQRPTGGCTFMEAAEREVSPLTESALSWNFGGTQISHKLHKSFHHSTERASTESWLFLCDYRRGSRGAASGKLLNDLFEFELDPGGANLTSTDLSAVQLGSTPSARACHGFSSLLGKLYVHGGSGMNGALTELGLKL
jgi:hypothetical protein